MTCRHEPGDRSCSTQYPPAPVLPPTPDKKNYTIEAAERVGNHLVLKVNYPNCSRCKFEGNKVMVFLNVTELDALKWKEIDPHFRDNKAKYLRAAPSPAARFPGSDEGWKDAIAYATHKRNSSGRD
jgi:hypothetical protein